MMDISITAISDTHGQVALPDLLKDHESDILIHCGDFTSGITNRFRKSTIHDSHMESWHRFLSELSAVKDQFRAMIVVPGNHDQICELMPKACQSQMLHIGGHLLINCDANISIKKPNVVGRQYRLRFWGIPHTLPFGSWFFQGYEMATITNEIHSTTEVIVSHGPPYSILDTVESVQPENIQPKDYLGSRDLYAKCQLLPDLKAVFFGHIHSSHGKKQVDAVDYFNCSILDEQYERRYNPITTTIKLDEEI